MERVYPEQSTEAQSIAGSWQSPGSVERTILHRGKSAIVGCGERGDACGRGGKSERDDRICPASRRLCWIGRTAVPVARWS